MRPVRRGARPRRTRRGTVRAGNEAGGDAAALECRDLREWISGGRRARVSGCRRLPKGARKPISPQYKGRADTSTITASRIPIMYRMEAPNALRYLRRPTTLR